MPSEDLCRNPPRPTREPSHDRDAPRARESGASAEVARPRARGASRARRRPPRRREPGDGDTHATRAWINISRARPRIKPFHVITLSPWGRALRLRRTRAGEMARERSAARAERRDADAKPKRESVSPIKPRESETCIAVVDVERAARRTNDTPNSCLDSHARRGAAHVPCRNMNISRQHAHRHAAREPSRRDCACREPVCMRRYTRSFLLVAQICKKILSSW